VFSSENPSPDARWSGTQFAPGANVNLATRTTPGWLLVAVLALVTPGAAQTQPGANPPAQTPAPQPTTKDALGRDTPRGTVRGFLAAARAGRDDVASQYLNTRLDGKAASALAHQLFVVLDARLPARLTELSDAPEGSLANPLLANQDLVGTVAGGDGVVEIVLDRVIRAEGGPVWLFSDKTLAAVPAMYQEITLGWGEGSLPRLLTGTRLGGVRLLEWVSVLLGLPIVYLVVVVLNKILTPLIRRLWQRLFKRSGLFARDVLPTPIRLLLLAFAIQWYRSSLPASLLVRQFWSNVAGVITIAAIVWLFILVNGEVERYLRRRFPGAVFAGAASLLRLARRVVDLLAIVIGVIALIRRFGIDPTPALAGLGVGGIAVALAAQKTLENVIAGTSLILDQAVRIGDVLKMGDVIGTVDHIGLRSTRIRTFDRTVVSVPNSQIANASLETLSARDKFWFHPVVGLRYETTPEQLRAVVDGFRRLLSEHPSVDRESVRVRFVRLGAFSLDVELFGYLIARDWNHFLEMQEQLLFAVTEIVEGAGTAIAFPSQMTYIADGPGGKPAADAAKGR
jgi:MscS family membrane protein